MVKIKELQSRIQVLGELVGRAMLAAKLGMQYDGKRDLYAALGYPDNITFVDYYARYRRQDIAKAIIDRPVNATWRGDVAVFETDEKETPFEKAWLEIERTLKVKSCFARVDRLAGLGQYAILVLGFDDVQTPLDMARPVKAGNRKLKYIKAISEANGLIGKYEMNTTDERYGLPTMYQVTFSVPGGMETSTVNVHYSRVIHIVSQLMNGEVEGIPRLEAVFNRLMDLDKVVGGSAEMFWRGARPGYQGKLDEDFTIGDKDIEELEAQIDEFEHNLRRFIINKGLSLESLSPQVADPTANVDTIISMICAETGIPKRILLGSERGELASTQDWDSWLTLINDRRNNYAEPIIVRPFVDRLIEVGALPKPSQEYSIVWEDLWSMSEKDKVEIGRSRAAALKDYVMSPGATDYMPTEAFLKYIMALEDEEIEWIDELRMGEIEEEGISMGEGEGEHAE